MELKSLNSFIDIAKKKTHKKIAVAAAEDLHVLLAVADAMNEGIAEPILVGNKDKIMSIADSIKFDISKIELIDEKDAAKSAKLAVQLVRDSAAHVLMKGLVTTPDYLRAVLHKETGLRKGDLLSHIGFFESPYYHKLLALTDAAQNVAPDINDKISIINNSVDLFHRLGVQCPKVAAIAAIEGVNPKMPVTTDAAILTMMNRRKQIKGCMIDGPLAFDNAVSKEAANQKGIDSEVAGDADLILAPNIEVGNALYKSFTYMGSATVAAVILGAAVPIVLTSRADTDRSKLMSIALAASY
ncbi:MAG: bifunctional enoyl-CoA hydratase/phosphate acetyltransferase [Candidatus Kapaibacterium sp.]|jgi:phosphate butyryltransferase|nr:bifunctional enoyl-CoA hydratase/phosphate acetyltransferase [Candidatus Kapabacteria bacterium]